MKVIIAVLSGLFSFFICYLIGAFYNVSFDLSIWTELSRLLISILGGLLSIISSLATFMYLEIESES